MTIIMFLDTRTTSLCMFKNDLAAVYNVIFYWNTQLYYSEIVRERENEIVFFSNSSNIHSQFKHTQCMNIFFS